MKCSRDVEKFRIEAKLSLMALLRREKIDTHRVVKEQIGRVLTQEISSFFRKQRVGNDENWSEI